MRRTHSDIGQQTLGYEKLEGRRLLAGNVTVFESGHLYIRGDQADNQFEIIAEGTHLKIQGINGTTINQSQSYLVEGAVASQNGLTFPGGLRAHLGPGNDEFWVRDAQFEMMSLVYGGTGDDSVSLVDTKFLDRTTFQTFDGDDTLFASGSQFMGDFFAITLDGDDVVTVVDSTFDKFSLISTGNHADTIQSDGNRYMGATNLILPLDGNDSVELNNPVVMDWMGVFLGDGDDSIKGDLTDAVMQGDLRIAGQGGVDESPTMLMSDHVAARTSMVTLEHREVFATSVGGAENVDGFHTISQRGNEFYEWYASPVTLGSTERIASVEWSGVYLRDGNNLDLPDRGDQFVIEIYEDLELETDPGQSPAARFEVGSANRVDVGARNQVKSLSGTVLWEYPIYEYSADIEFTMEAGKQYWVSVWKKLNETELQEGNGWAWGWADSTSGSTAMVVGWDTDPDVGGYHSAGNGGYPAVDMRLRT